MTMDWLQRPEGGTTLALQTLKTLAFALGRNVSRAALVPITIYFLLRRTPERRASRAYLARVLGRPPTWLEIARHFHAFAGVTLDRLYFLTNSLWRFDVRFDGLEDLHRAMDMGRGVLLIGAHVGSFDALRAASTYRPEVTVRVVLDADHSPALSAILKELNPSMAAGIINPRQNGTTVALEIGAALNAGSLVTMLADRGRPGNVTTKVTFLGDRAEFPTAPWQIAAALHVPVVLCAGLYGGGNRYDLHFELITEALQIDRRQRQQQLQVIVQDFANRLETLVRSAPYNWFNFYDFWNAPSAGNKPAAVDAGHGPGV